MELFHPKQTIGKQEIADLTLIVIKDICTPMRMFSTSWIRMLIQWLSVKHTKSVRIFREMCRYPVQDHANPLVMHIIYKIHKIIRIAISSGWSIITRYLISPRAVKRMLRNSHQFNMCISHFMDILRDHWRKLSIGEESIIIIFHTFSPRTQMHLIDRHRLLPQRLSRLLGTVMHPAVIIPMIYIQICHNRCVIWTQLSTVSIRI